MCIVLAGLAAGFLALTSYFVIREYRYRAFEDQAIRKVDLTSLLLPSGDADTAELAESLAEYGQRGGFDAIAVKGDVIGSSSPSVDYEAVPAELRDDPEAAPTGVKSQLAGREALVLGRLGADDQTKLYFFFPTEDLRASISQFRNVLAGAWLVTVALGALVGIWVARRMLRPVRDAAKSAQALAARLLDGDASTETDDEFELWVESYNELATALEAKITELSNAADRERRFTSDVAHELRTPLTGLASASSLLEQQIERLPVEARRPAELLIEDVRRLQALVLELLELARLDAGAQALHLEPLRLEEAVRAVVRARPGTAAVRFNIDPSLVVLADRARFKRVLGNLIDNALSHGGTVAFVQARRRGPLVDIDIIDDGPGVTLADADAIFDRFFKAHIGRSHAGSGLGLAIARKHAWALGGSLVLANAGERGAQFIFSLRAAHTSDDTRLDGGTSDADVEEVDPVYERDR
jgi:two-component system sensor histidine kinase MtrB